MSVDAVGRDVVRLPGELAVRGDADGEDRTAGDKAVVYGWYEIDDAACDKEHEERDGGNDDAARRELARGIGAPAGEWFWTHG